MPDRRWTAQEGFCDLPLAILVAAVVMGLGSVAAGFSRPITDPRPDRAPVGSAPVGAPQLAIDPSSGRSHGEAAGMSTFGSLDTRAQWRDEALDDRLSRAVDDDDPRAFLAHMTAVMHRRGQPLPGDVGRLQSLVNISPPTATTAPQHPSASPATRETPARSLDAD